MNINDAYPSNYLKSSDLHGRRIKVEIDRVSMEEFNNKGKTETKPVLFFAGKAKGLVLNKTNAMLLASYFSPETDGWVGKTVILYSERVPFQGQMVDSLRIQVEQPEAKPAEVDF